MPSNEYFPKLACSEFPSQLKVINLNHRLFDLFSVLDFGEGPCRRNAIIKLFLFVKKDHFENLIVGLDCGFIHVLW